MTKREDFSVETRWAGSGDYPSQRRMRVILDELDTPDPEQPDTWLTHSSGWTLTADEDDYLVFSNPEQEVVGHLAGEPRERTLEVWVTFSRGDIESVLKERWLSGRPPIDPAKIAAIAIARPAYTLGCPQILWTTE